MKKTTEMLANNKLEQMLKAYLRSTGNLIPRHPEEIRTFEKRKIETPDFTKDQEEDPLNILQRGYIPYELSIKHNPKIVSEPQGFSMNWAARNGVSLSENTIQKITRQIEEDESSAENQ